METQTETGALAAIPTFAQVTLKKPITRGEKTIDTIGLRRPDSGELRGLSLVAVARLEVDVIATLIARIAVPHVSPEEFTRMDPSDMLAIGGVIAGFFGD